MFGIYFQNGGKRVKPKQKVAYLSKYCFDFDDVDIKLYVFWHADAMYEVNGEVRGLVLYDGNRTNSISRVFSKWSRSKSISQYQCNFDFILDHRRQKLSYFRSNINRTGVCKNITN